MLSNPSTNNATTLSELANGSICSTQIDQEAFLQVVKIGKSYLTHTARVIANEILRYASPLPSAKNYEYFKPSDTREYQILAAVAVLFNEPYQRNQEKPQNSSSTDTHYFNEFFHFVEIGKLVLNDLAKKRLQKMLDDDNISMNMTKNEALKAYDMDAFRVMAALGRMFYLAIEAEEMVKGKLAKEKNRIKEFLRVDAFEGKWRAINDKNEIESDGNYEKKNLRLMPRPIVTDSTPKVLKTAEKKTTPIESAPTVSTATGLETSPTTSTATVPTTIARKNSFFEPTVPMSTQRSTAEFTPYDTKTTGFQSSTARLTSTIPTTLQPKTSTTESPTVSTTIGLEHTAIESISTQLTTMELEGSTAEPALTVPDTAAISTSVAKLTSTLLTTMGLDGSTAEPASAVPATTSFPTSAVYLTSTLLTTKEFKSSTAEPASTVPATTSFPTPAVKLTSTLLTTMGFEGSTVESTSTVPATTAFQTLATESTPTLSMVIGLKTSTTK